MMSEHSLRDLVASLASENAKLKASQATSPEAPNKTEAVLKQFADDGYSFDADAQRATIEAIGLERWQSNVAIHFSQAPIEARTPSGVSKKDKAFLAFSEDDILKQFSDLDEKSKMVALSASTDYDQLAAQGRAPCSDKKSYIQVCLRHEGK